MQSNFLKNIKIFFATATILVSNNVFAEIVTYKFEAQITALEGADYHTLSVGDTLSFEVDYDRDAGGFYIKEWDDRESSFLCSKEAAPFRDDCDVVIEDYTLYADNLDVKPTDFSHLIDLEKFDLDGSRWGDLTDENRAFVWESYYPSGYNPIWVYLSNDFMFFRDIIRPSNFLQFHYYDNNGDVQSFKYHYASSSYSFTSQSGPSTDVNEPLTAALLTVGFAAFARRKLRKK